MGNTPDKIVLIPIGVDTSLFRSVTAVDRDSSRKKFAIPDDSIVIGSFQKDGVGWGKGLQPKLIKGPDLYVDNFFLKRIGYPVFAFLTGPSRGYVKSRLQELGIPFIHKYVQDRSELVSCYHALDLYLVTSREEGGPMGLLESLSSGIPVVSTKVGMAPDLIQDGLNGYISTSFSSMNLSTLVESVISRDTNDIQRSAIRASARSVDWSVVSELHFAKVYSLLCYL